MKGPGRVALLLLVTACVAQPVRAERKKKPVEAPCSPHVPAFRHHRLVLSVNINYGYQAKDPSVARPYHQDDVIAQLNTLGQSDGNTFAPQNGDALNFTLTYTINNDGQDHFAGSLRFAGWGQGLIHNFHTTNAYVDTTAMIRDLTAQAYTFINQGWHDNRPQCQPGAAPAPTK